jgi:hypothetical protein
MRYEDAGGQLLGVEVLVPKKVTASVPPIVN